MENLADRGFGDVPVPSLSGVAGIGPVSHPHQSLAKAMRGFHLTYKYSWIQMKLKQAKRIKSFGAQHRVISFKKTKPSNFKWSLISFQA